MTDPYPIYVVDDDEAVLHSVQAVLNQFGYMCHCYLTAERFLREAPRDKPGCVVTDLQMPGISGVELQQILLADESPLAVVVVTGVADVPTTVALMERGAVTLLEKPYNSNDLVQAIERALEVSRNRWLQKLNYQSVVDRLATLSEDERSVMELMLSGQTNKAVAYRLHLSMRTVDRRRKTVLMKMGVRTAPELALLLGTAGISFSPSEDSANGMDNSSVARLSNGDATAD